MSIELGRRLQLYRINCGYSQQNIADALSVDRSTYAYYESGKTEPDLKSLVTIARVLGVTTAHLIPIAGEEGELTVADINRAKEQKSRNKSADERTSSVYNLSKSEKAVVALFRAMDKDKKQLLTDYAKTLCKDE